jgi:hypothetical protein
MLEPFSSSTLSRCPNILVLASNTPNATNITNEINSLESDRFYFNSGYQLLASACSFSVRGEQQCRYVRLQHIIILMPLIKKLTLLILIGVIPLVTLRPIPIFFYWFPQTFGS